MKKKIIVFGSFLACFIMLMIPNVNAVEYHAVEETVQQHMNQHIFNLVTTLKNVNIGDLTVSVILFSIFFVLLLPSFIVSPVIIDIFFNILAVIMNVLHIDKPETEIGEFIWFYFFAGIIMIATLTSLSIPFFLKNLLISRERINRNIIDGSFISAYVVTFLIWIVLEKLGIITYPDQT